MNYLIIIFILIILFFILLAILTHTNDHHLTVSKTDKFNMLVLAQSYGFYSNIGISFMNTVSECAKRLVSVNPHKWKKIMKEYKDLENIKLKIADHVYYEVIKCNTPQVIESKEPSKYIKIAYKLRINYNNYLLGILTIECRDPIIIDEDKAVLMRILRWYGEDSVGIKYGKYKIDYQGERVEIVSVI